MKQRVMKLNKKNGVKITIETDHEKQEYFSKQFQIALLEGKKVEVLGAGHMCEGCAVNLLVNMAKALSIQIKDDISVERLLMMARDKELVESYEKHKVIDDDFEEFLIEKIKDGSMDDFMKNLKKLAFDVNNIDKVKNSLNDIDRARFDRIVKHGAEGNGFDVLSSEDREFFIDVLMKATIITDKEEDVH